MNQYRTERRARRFDRLAIRRMKTATYIVTDKSGKAYRWKFTEHRGNGDYGNGVYIAVKTPSGDIFSLDRRYAYNYDFRKACVDYLLVYYGDTISIPFTSTSKVPFLSGTIRTIFAVLYVIFSPLGVVSSINIKNTPLKIKHICRE